MPPITLAPCGQRGAPGTLLCTSRVVRLAGVEWFCSPRSPMVSTVRRSENELALGASSAAGTPVHAIVRLASLSVRTARRTRSLITPLLGRMSSFIALSFGTMSGSCSRRNQRTGKPCFASSYLYLLRAISMSTYPNSF